MHRKESTIKRNFQKLRKSPGVRYESVGRGFEQGGGAQRRKQSAQCNNDDRSLRLKQGGVVGAAF